MSKLLIIVVSLGYLALLFAIAYWVERQRKAGKQVLNNAWIYSLSLAVYCTGWTYYGSVGRATTTGADFLAIYIGPSITCALFIPVLLKIVRISKTYRISSIADFLSTRYSKSFSVGVIVTLCCVLGIIPYISLQLKAISDSFHVITNNIPTGKDFWADDTFYISVIISVFIIIFGTRSVDASERHEGLIAAITFESVVKLIAFVSAGIFVTYGIFNGFGNLFEVARENGLDNLYKLNTDGSYSTWLSMVLVSMIAIILLPRQFQVSVVENTNERHIKKAVWLFPLYLFIINIFVLPIAIGGTIVLSDKWHPDTYVLSLPMHFNKSLLSTFVYIGGFSAASSMIIVETIALATMVSNHLVMPILLSTTDFRIYKNRPVTKQIVNSRRASIVVILLIAYLYNRYIAQYFSLVSIGLVSMSAIAQLAPSVIGALFWKKATRQGAIWGIMAGFITWTYTLILPSIINAAGLDTTLLTDGLFHIWWLKPQALFGMEGFSALPHTVFWSLLINTLFFVGVSVYTRSTPQDDYQANIFVNIFNNASQGNESVWKGTVYTKDIRNLLAGFIGKERSENLLSSYTKRYSIEMGPMQQEAHPRIVSFTEKILSGVIGSASARFMISNITQEEKININEVMSIVKESQQVLELNKELKKKSLELTKTTDQLVRLNEQLKKTDELKDEFLYTVTHEIRTPLTSIRALSEILYDNTDLDTEQQQLYLDSIVRETERLSHLITQVLNLERYESGRQRLHLSAQNITALIREVIVSLKPLADEKSITIQFSEPSSMIVMQCDKDLLKQVMYNLVSNALKYTPAGTGLIKIVLLTEYDELKIWVEDNGKGIPKELHTLIFDKFFQANNQTLQKPEGSGLGLAICKKIVELHDGRIWAENTGGAGVRFVFTLPYNG